MEVKEVITLKGWADGKGWIYEQCYNNKIIEISKTNLNTIDWSWWETDINNPPSQEVDVLIIVDLYEDDKPLAHFEKWASEIWAERHAE